MKMKTQQTIRGSVAVVIALLILDRILCILYMF